MLQTRRKLIAGAFSCASFWKVSAEEAELRHLAPSESAFRDESFLAFVSSLKAIASKKDSKALLALMSPTFRVDFAFGKGPAAFVRRWKPQAATSEVWGVLDRLLAVPAKRYSDDLYVVPYVYGAFPIDLDPMAHVVAVGDAVAVREQPDAQSKELAVVNHAILAVQEKLAVPVRLERTEWLRVTLKDGLSGHVRTREVYSPAEYRVFFEKQKGQWRWLSLVCAD